MKTKNFQQAQNGANDLLDWAVSKYKKQPHSHEQQTNKPILRNYIVGTEDMYPRFVRTDLLFLSPIKSIGFAEGVPYVVDTTNFGAMLRFLRYDANGDIEAYSTNEDTYPCIKISKDEIIGIYGIDLMYRQNI